MKENGFISGAHLITTPDANIAKAGALRRVFGPEIRDMKRMMQNPDLAEFHEYRYLRDQLDGNFQDFINQHLSVDGVPVATTQELIRDSNDVRLEVESRLFPNGTQSPGILNNARFASKSITDSRLRDLFSSNISEKMAHEYAQQLAIGYGCGLIRKRSEEFHLPEKVYELVNALEDRVWVGPKGHTDRVEIKADHNNDTNRVQDPMEYAHPAQALNFHTKRHQYDVRTADLGGSTVQVFADIREKPIHKQYLKALRESLALKKPINPNAGVRDSLGALFVILGNEKQAAEFEGTFFDVIHQMYGIKEILPDHKPEQFVRRWNITPWGWPVHLEALFYHSLEDHLNSKYETKVEPDDEGITGRAHDIYVIDRYVDVAPIFLPESVYGLNIPRVIDEAKEAQAAFLSQKNRIHTPELAISR